MPASEPAVGDLARLTERVETELALLNYPSRPWTVPRTTSTGQHVYDVAIVGGGQGGLVTAFALARECVTNVIVLDQQPLDRAGPWLRFARMRTLRTPKYLTGPDLGVPSLTPRAWYEAVHGEGSWERLTFLPKEAWAAYLGWYRRTLALPVRPDTQVGAIAHRPDEQVWALPVRTHGVEETLFARRVVLATGIEGSGAWQVPRFVREALPPDRYAHTAEAIDFAALRGRRVAVLGAGASAFDNAAVALEHGAREVRLFFRRPSAVTVNAYRWAEFAGFLKHFGELPDADKWRFMAQLMRMGQLPPADTVRRIEALPGFHLHPGAAVSRLSLGAHGIVLDTAAGRFDADYLIVGTGFITDLRLRPELADIEPEIARWSDRFTPPPEAQHDDLARHPYLGPHFELTARREGAAPYLSTVYNFTFGGLLSLGFGGASISGMKYAVPRLTAGITGSLFVEDRERHFASLCAYDQKEF